MCVKGHGKYQMFWGCSLFLSGLKHLILCSFRYLAKCSEGDGLNNLRSCLHDTGMTFIPERVHSIFIYFFVSVHMILFLYQSFQNEFTPVFILSEILVLVQNVILVSYKLKTNFVANGVGRGREVHEHLIWCENHTIQNALGCLCLILSCECSMNFTLEWNLLRNQSFRYHINSSKE